MCGIVGYSGTKNAKDVIITSLEHLEYRGYDSAGIALSIETNNVLIKKAVGKLAVLKDQVALLDVTAKSGMGHTRWATHGAPSFNNAHPHRHGRVTLIHNGILENHRTIKQKLVDKGHHFYSSTDTEVAAHLLDSFLAEGHDPIKALGMLCDTVHGAYSFGIMIDYDPDRIYFAKCGSPLIAAYNEGECFFASDQTALVDHQPVYYSLNDNEIGYIEKNGVAIFDLSGRRKIVDWLPLTAKKENIQKMNHKHFMHKEIFEQPNIIDRVLAGRLHGDKIDYLGFDLDFAAIAKADKVQIIACGSAYYAGLIAKNGLEATLRLPVSVEVASEYRYRDTLTDEKTLVIAVSQSGETVDTVAALDKALSLGAMCMSVCNVLGSVIATRCESSMGNFFLNAGPEISVASTKAFIAQVIALKLLTYAFQKSFADWIKM